MANNTPATTGGNNKPAASSNVKAYLKDEGVRKRIEDLLGRRADQFVTSVTSMVNADDKLARCEPTSLLMACLTAAALDLPVNKTLGFAHIVPYDNRKLNVTEAQFQIGWRGYVQLAQRSGQYKTIAAAPVYEGQLIDQDPLLGNTYDWNQRSGDTIVGYVAKIKLINGFEKELFMTTDEVQKHAQQYSKAYNGGKGSGPWKDNFDAMALKTVVKQLISKWGPMSVDTVMQQAVAADQAIIREDGTHDYIDGTIVEQETEDDTRNKIAEAAAKKRQEMDNGNHTPTTVETKTEATSQADAPADEESK